jgi:hypothetical protein
MKEIDQIKNILAFLSIMFGESTVWETDIMNKDPKYLIEKFNRYIQSVRSAHPWGLHPSLRNTVFNRYCKKYSIGTDQFDEDTGIESNDF